MSRDLISTAYRTISKQVDVFVELNVECRKLERLTDLSRENEEMDYFEKARTILKERAVGTVSKLVKCYGKDGRMTLVAERSELAQCARDMCFLFYN